MTGFHRRHLLAGLAAGLVMRPAFSPSREGDHRAQGDAGGAAGVRPGARSLNIFLKGDSSQRVSKPLILRDESSTFN
jgi:hypothetical protein